jgi:acetyltransferase-like isoleucine patch superfamily enzyme
LKKPTTGGWTAGLDLFHLNVDATDMLVGPVVIGRGAGVSTAATILPGVTIGAEAWIGAGAVVTADIPERAIAVSVPAKVIRLRPPAD